MEFKSEEILKLIERASGIPDILAKQEELEELVSKFKSVEEYIGRFKSLEELTIHLKSLEDKLYVMKTYLNTEEAAKYLSVRKFAILEAAKRRELPFYTPRTKGYYFMREELDEWIGRFRVASQLEEDEEVDFNQRAALAASRKKKRKA